MTTMKISETTSAKASFDEIYVKNDPRDYYSVLGSLDYAIPDIARPIIRQIINAWRAEAGRSSTVLDLGSSYGVNAALLRYPLTFDMLRRRYTRREMLALSSEDLRALDRRYFQSWPRTSAERVVVLDASRSAVDYAMSVGIADVGVAADFERDAPDADAAHTLSSVDIVMSTGCVGYVGVKTFDAILSAKPVAPWVISFVLRMYDYSEIEARLTASGLVTEKLASAAFLQRRFRDEDEAQQVLDVIRKRGLDPAGLEADGLMLAELYVSRPPETVEKTSLEQLVTITSGRNLSIGPRYVQFRRDGRSEIMSAR